MEEQRYQSWQSESKVSEIGGTLAAEEDIPINYPLQTVVPRRQLTRQEQLALKPVVQKLYIEEGLTFPEVQRVLQTEYNFNPT